MENTIGSPTVLPSVPRPKASRSNSTAGMVHPRASSPSNDNDGRPPTKRARKAINCEPCRNSKLKCDRNRPCSSCVLRGTSAQCYQDGRGHEPQDGGGRGEEQQYVRVDPAQEISRMRNALNLLEQHIFPSQRTPSTHLSNGRRDHTVIIPKKESPELDSKAVQGILGSEGQSYAGATSAATHLILNESGESEDCDSRQISPNQDFSTAPEYDRDLLAMLPSLIIIDGLITYYFEYCNWIYRHVNHNAFTQNWERFKSGKSADRILLSTVCTMMAIAVHYLPNRHHLLETLSGTHDELGQKYYELSQSALDRRMAESKKYSLELVELLLARSHYLTLCKTDVEEIWHVMGEVSTIGKAMGLHRDPGKWKMARATAERRRWAWWHIVLLERWQAFMFGRPLSIASHHFDTQLPSDCDPNDKTRRLYLPNIALFKLARILGDIMDDAVSVRPVPYENVQSNDRQLMQWMDSLPEELNLDEYRVARNLASTNTATRRQGVQSVIIRSSFYHIRFTLHRPYATIASPMTNKSGKSIESTLVSKSAASLEIAVSAADKLITIVGQSRPDILANPVLAVPGHMSWGPFHCFSAAMFFSFQLISSPDQPGVGLFRANIQKAIKTLEQSRGNSVADKAYDILHALSPLYSVEFPQEVPETRSQIRSQVLSTVRKLAFPYHDSQNARRSTDSPSGRGTHSSPSQQSMSPPIPEMGLAQPYDAMQSMSTTARTQAQMTGMYPTIPDSPSQELSPEAALVTSPYVQPHLYSQQQTYPPPSELRYASYANSQTIDESAMWGASVGIGHGEWAQFINQLQPSSPHVPRPDPSPTNRLLPQHSGS